ncbi:MAG: glycosyltransferase family 39 protein [Parcubacteria group bacterium]|jgi:hypothetical protein
MFSLEKIKEKKWELIFVLSLIFLGIFLRTFHFSKWLHFEIDQSYDYLMVSPAVEKGIGNLPLLGPTAGGGRALRLGPAFYYMEYLSAKVFGNNPTGHAMLVLILSIFSLPIFYLFSRRYFSKNISIGLLAIFSTSVYMVLYSRFSWSPNVLPFLTLLTFYALLQSVSEKEKNKDRWFLFFAFLIGVSTQIHFNSFFIIPAVAIIFLLIKRPKFKLKTWGLAIAIFLFLYSPVIVNEIKTGGQDIAFFQEKISGESSDETTQDPGKDDKKSGEKLFQNFRYHAYEYFLIISGNDTINGNRPKGYDLGLTCKTCSDKLPWRTSGLILFLFGTILLACKLTKEKDSERKNFLLISALWLAASFLYFFAITYDGLYIYPRFFLVVAPLPFILLGLIFESLGADKNRISLLAFAAAILFLSFANTQKLKDDFSQLKNAPIQDKKVEKEDVFPNNYRVTQEQQILITDYIASEFKQNSYPVYIKTIHEYEPAFWYYLGQKGIYYYGKMKPETVYKQGNYFLVLYSSDSNKEIKEYGDTFNIAEEKEFGVLTVFQLNPKPASITGERQSDSKRETPVQAQQISKLLTWKKLFSKQ